MNIPVIGDIYSGSPISDILQYLMILCLKSEPDVGIPRQRIYSQRMENSLYNPCF